MSDPYDYGIEYISIFAALGVAVTLVERRERSLEFLDREIVDELFHQMRARNVTFRFAEAVESIEVADGPPRKAVLHLESGKRIVTDMVLYSAGRIAATDTLFNYPTLAECYKVAALDASNKLRY